MSISTATGYDLINYYNEIKNQIMINETKVDLTKLTDLTYDWFNFTISEDEIAKFYFDFLVQFGCSFRVNVWDYTFDVTKGNKRYCAEVRGEKINSYSLNGLKNSIMEFLNTEFNNTDY